MLRKTQAVDAILEILNEFEPEEWEEILQEIELQRHSKLEAKRFWRTIKWLGLEKYFKGR